MSWKRGAYPEFTLEDAVAVLFMLQNPTGRKAISEALNLGEGSVRTLLRKLSNIGAISSAQRGHSLNKRGMGLLEGISRHFSEVRRIGEIEGYPAFALTVREPGEFKSIELRDEAIRFFAKGAMILVVRNGEPVFPEDGRPLSETMPELAERVKEAFKLEDGELVVITWAEKEANAMKSAYHVALSLKEEVLPEEIKSLVR
ncbi:DUF4443 domain-containing protein [Thermococcus aciditolerans]|uniref:DUF4443 domain-containing protein n=1 Tax=Thermococcus aciditolerans TaxID=2598455 RepID=A0A5C0SP45_9EURY|nr:DUF4443 domain-containing protein [Thermococcus aciditolerans]QEK15557.1 DUF4443 domain-containing protein [Thermococcus aciditolerans]